MNNSRAILFFLILMCGLTFPTFFAYASDDDCTPGIPCIKEKSEKGEPLEGREGCDVDFMNQLKARAYLGAERVALTAQTAITKPDSVLEYSCFDKMVGIVANVAGPIFTESTHWKNVKVPISNDKKIKYNLQVFMGDKKLDTSLENVVLKALDSYAKDSFSHSFLGGNSEGYNSIIGSVTTASYDCYHMNDVWVEAQCRNFDTGTVRSATFQELIEDPRALPLECKGTTISQDLIDVSQNTEGEYSNVSLVDEELLEATSLKECGDPVPTGPEYLKIIVIEDDFLEPIVERESRPDMVCITPGCSYNRDSGKCE